MDTEALARAVKEARGTTSQVDAVNRAKNAGHQISLQTWRNIEQGRHESYWDKTLFGVDAGLSWEPGTARTILTGEEPRRDNGLADRLARIEAQLAGATSEVKEITALDAMVVVLGRLDDDQYRCVALAVSADPRFNVVVG